MNFSIREAQPSDANRVFDLIKELCVYQEKPLSEVVITAQDLIDDGLQSGNLFRCLVAEIEPSEEADKQDMKEMAGYALYFYGYSTWKGRLLYLEDMYVQPKYRGIGIGTGFFKRIGQIAVAMKCCRIAFTCLDWNVSAKEFYNKIGSEEQPDWKLFYFKSNSIENFLSKFT
ncbi:diamine acetyltransferase 1-like [Rhopilema esculentum]|uniref:diamine acetyltransferase 1-like n=1 Tax=Rhopilema esculentum TaxID=499914 RepID=UPI0031D5CE07